MTNNEIKEACSAHYEHCRCCTYFRFPDNVCVRTGLPFSNLFPEFRSPYIPEYLMEPHVYQTPQHLAKAPRCDKYRREEGQ